MKRLTITILTVLAAACTLLAQEPRAVHHTFAHQGLEREYWLYVPPVCEGCGDVPEGDNCLTAGMPLVFVLHGYGASAENYFPSMLKEARERGFAVCVPQGWTDSRGKTGWVVGYPSQEGSTVDDVDFLCSLASHLQQNWGFSVHDTFVTGMSNGGEMCYILAYLKPDVFAAVAPISGLTMEWAMKTLEASRPVPLMELHGTEDTTSRWEGDPDNQYGWGRYIAVPIAVGNWVHIDRCTHEISTELPLKSPESHKVILHRYVGGTGGCEVRLYEIVGGKHSKHEKDLDTAAEIWSFFSLYLE